MTSKAEGAEVLVKLVVDTNAEKATTKLKDGLDKAEKKHAKWHRGVLDGKRVWGGLKTVAVGSLGAAATAATALGVASIGAAMGAAHAYQESENQVRSLASAMTLLDTGQISFEKMIDVAGNLKDELEGIAMAVGTSDDAMVAAFTNVLERGGKTIDQAIALTAEMAKAGRAIPGGVEGVSEAFEQIEMGIIRAKNPIVGMIAATHLLKGNAKSVAAQMQKMSPEAQMKLAEKAVSAMAKKMADVPLSIGEMSKSMSVFTGNLAETAGAPIMKSIQPIFEKINKWLNDNQELMTSVAKDFGNAAATLIDAAGPFVDEALIVAKEFATSMHSTEGPIAKLKEAFQFIKENTGPLVDVFGLLARAAIVVPKSVVTIIEASVKAFQAIIDAVSRIKDPFSGQPLLGKGMAKSAGGRDLTGARKEAMSGATPGAMGDASKIAALKDSYVQAMTLSGEDAKQAAAQFDADVQQSAELHAETMGIASAQYGAAVNGDAVAFARAWDQAAASNDEEAKKFVAGFLRDSKDLQTALGKTAPGIITSGFDKMIASIEGMEGMGQITKDLAAAQAKRAKESVKIGNQPNINQTFTGGINIRQDFKDEDPERVAIVFRNDLAKHGMARLQAKGALGGGS